MIRLCRDLSHLVPRTPISSAHVSRGGFNLFRHEVTVTPRFDVRVMSTASFNISAEKNVFSLDPETKAFFKELDEKLKPKFEQLRLSVKIKAKERREAADAARTDPVVVEKLRKDLAIPGKGQEAISSMLALWNPKSTY